MSTSVLFGTRALQPATRFNPMIQTAFGAGSSPFALGTPVRPDFDRDRIITRAQANTAPRARAIGLTATPSTAGEPVRTQFCGPLDLTADQWDQVTDDTGGLVAGATYFLSSATPGKLTRTPPSTPGTFVVKLGVGLGPRSMMVQVSAPKAA